MRSCSAGLGITEMRITSYMRLLDEDNIGSNNYTYYKNDELHDIS